MVARFATLLTMWRTGFWHGRWATLALGAAALALGLATILLAPSLAVLAAGLLLFGVGMGLTYCAAIYYSLAVGHAAVDAGGAFEALIGFGYFAGPLHRPGRAGGRRRRRTRRPRRSGSPGSSRPPAARARSGPIGPPAARAALTAVNARGRAPCTAPRSSAPISRMPRWLDRDRQRRQRALEEARALVVVEIGEQDRGQRDAAPRAAGAGSRMPCVSASRRRRSGVEAGRHGAALVDQPLGRRAAEVQVQQQAVRAGGGGARAFEVGRRRRT